MKKILMILALALSFNSFAGDVTVEVNGNEGNIISYSPSARKGVISLRIKTNMVDVILTEQLTTKELGLKIYDLIVFLKNVGDARLKCDFPSSRMYSGSEAPICQGVKIIIQH